MGERKVLNKYFPPDFDPAKIPRTKKGKTNEMKVRMMLPMSLRCKTCGAYMYKGTKFNTRKEDVVGENYLGIQVFRFYFRCSTCAAEITFKTDPENSDYAMEHGASRNYEPWREKDVVAAATKAEREEEERGNAMKALENRTLDSKREMDILAALDEMRSLKARHEAVGIDEALAAIRRSADAEQEGAAAAAEVQINEEDEQALRSLFFAQRAQQVKRLPPTTTVAGIDVDSGDDAGPSGAGPAANGGPSGEGGPSGAPAAADGPIHSGGNNAKEPLAAAGGGSSKPGAARPKPFGIVVKPKKKQRVEPPAPAPAAAAAEKEEEEGIGGLAGLVGYGSSDGDS